MERAHPRALPRTGVEAFRPRVRIAGREYPGDLEHRPAADRPARLLFAMDAPAPPLRIAARAGPRRTVGPSLPGVVARGLRPALVQSADLVCVWPAPHRMRTRLRRLRRT